MDTDFMNFKDEEYFPPFEQVGFLDSGPDDSTSADGANNYNTWEWEQEREINGDIALIPITGNYDPEMSNLSMSPPLKEEFTRLITDWHHIITMETSPSDSLARDSLLETTPISEEVPQDFLAVAAEDSSNSTFDLASFLLETEPKPETPIQEQPEPKLRLGGKRIDMKAQRYIVDDPEDAHVDVETISERGDSPVLEAGDLNSLLEQFEATSGMCDKEDGQSNVDVEDINVEYNTVQFECVEPNFESAEAKLKNSDVKLECAAVKFESVDRKIDCGDIRVECADVKIDCVKPVVECVAVNEEKPVQLEKCDAVDVKKDIQIENDDSNIVVLTKSPEQNAPPPESSSDVAKSKQILEALPQELIKRIKESGKRKPISVIPPIPNKKPRLGPRVQESSPQLVKNKFSKLVNSDAVQLDHDYCTSLSPYPKNPKKDSGFESSEEDERAILRNQPTVKNADGKLMVSLLKSNTIKPTANQIAENKQQKRKLNLAEYKKRREFSVQSNENSQNNSPMNSGRNSPTAVEDENTKRQKHQEKLMRMAMELLNTPAKSSTGMEPLHTPQKLSPRVNLMNTPAKPTTIKQESNPATPKPVPPTPSPPAVALPPDMEVKTLLSVGTNTPTIGSLPLCAEPVVEAIKPLLQNAKIGTNSLITSVIENIPKVKSKKNATDRDKKARAKLATEEHGENKTIVYLPKNRALPSTCSVAVQTECSGLMPEKREKYCSSVEGKRRPRHRRKRSTSGSSRYSSSGSYCSSSSRSSSRSRSRSRSVSPRYTKRKRSMDRERMQEVEERRVVYVGRISYSTTREDLRRRFQSFGPISSVSVHFREHGDNYGFVTFLNKLDAYEAMEHGNDDPFYPKYDLSFGGRRIFCKTSYSDLDNMHEDIGCYPPRPDEDSFDSLLRKAQEQLRKRKL